jgi:polysaccharide deacetylase family protein (PEP-CTERM system associated)
MHESWPARRVTEPLVNALSIDVEDYFQVSALAPYIARSDWDSIPCRVERNVERLLVLFAERGARATFFVLGWIAERYPQLVRAIAAGGHEVASHGYAHLRATEQTPHEFLGDISRAKSILEDITGSLIAGYRAPSFSIGPQNPWAFDCIARAGYRYSSSVYPVRHDHYGAPDAPRFAHRTPQGVVEIPITTTRTLGRNFPAGGGGYFRLAPYAVSRWAIRRVNAEGQPAIFYMHPWEIDPDQPRIRQAALKARLRHYLNLARMEVRLKRLLGDFRWDRIDGAFQAHLSHDS